MDGIGFWVKEIITSINGIGFLTDWERIFESLERKLNSIIT